VTLKYRLEIIKVIETGTIRKLVAVSYSLSMVTMVVSCIISEMKRDIGRKSRFFNVPL